MKGVSNLDGVEESGPRAHFHRYQGGVSPPPLSTSSDTSSSDGQPQLPPPYSKTMSTEKQKKANKDKYDKEEKYVEDLGESFMKIIKAALAIQGESTLDTC